MNDQLPVVNPPHEDTLKLAKQDVQDALKLTQKEKSKTGELPQGDRLRLPLEASLPYGLNTRGVSEFIKLPQNNAELGPRWLISVNGLGAQKSTIGIEVVGDVVLGTTRNGLGFPDFDLGKYDGDEKGVSRHHAVLRPSSSKLYLIDLRSTNGTRVNALPINPGMAMEVQDGDIVSLGALTMTIHVLASPSQIEKMAKEKADKERADIVRADKEQAEAAQAAPPAAPNPFAPAPPPSVPAPEEPKPMTPPQQTINPLTPQPTNPASPGTPPTPVEPPPTPTPQPAPPTVPVEPPLPTPVEPPPTTPVEPAPTTPAAPPPPVPPTSEVKSEQTKGVETGSTTISIDPTGKQP